MTDWIPVKEAARHLGYSGSYVRKLCAAGRLQVVKHAQQWYIHRSCLSGQEHERNGAVEFSYVGTTELCKLLGLRSSFAVRRRIRLGQLEGASKSPFKNWSVPRSAVPD